MEDIADFMTTRPPTARRPLLGLTVLVVEDSRFACEAVRLLCLRSGARIRRADSLEHAQKHLSVYRPSVLIVDVGLPDGSGLALIEASAKAVSPIDVVLGTSGDADAKAAVLSAGANGFLPKPIANLSAFQSAILMHLPHDRHPPGPRLVSNEVVHPDMLAYQDDLNHMASVIGTVGGFESVGYVTQFLRGVARSVDDDDLDAAATALAAKFANGQSTADDLTALGAMVQDRLNGASAI